MTERPADPPGTDHYEVLHVARHASPPVIEAAYRALARKHHPDAGTEPDERRMMQLTWAYAVLSDPARRARHDAELADGTAADETAGRPGWGEDDVVDEVGADVGLAGGTEARAPTGRERARRAAAAGAAELLERAIGNLLISALATAAAGLILVVVGPVLGRVVGGAWDGVADWISSDDREVARWETDRGISDAVAFSADGETVAAAGGRRARVWDVRSHERVATLRHEHGIWDLDLSPDGTRLAATTGGPVIHLWDVRTGRRTAEIDTGINVIPVRFSPDGRVLVASGRHTQLWDVHTRRRIATLDRFAPHLQVGISADGRLLATSGPTGEVALWDMETHRLRGHIDTGGEVLGMALSGDGEVVATSGRSEDVRLWSTRSRRQVGTLEHDIPRDRSGPLQDFGPAVYSVEMSPDGQLLATDASDQSLRLWDVGEREEIDTVADKTDLFASVGSFSPDGDLFAWSTLHEVVLRRVGDG